MKSAARSNEWVLTVKGLKCQACCARLKRHILEHGGVNGCDIDFKKEELRVQGTALQEGKLISLIEQLGYEAQLVKNSNAQSSIQREVAECNDFPE